mmetsp:Transcript_127915/g.409769  ORF Transcript_127915/g.409769 Transcript_127915/m.409769 type:complete len:220 (-) Transcript_127915:856-1515(-)
MCTLMHLIQKWLLTCEPFLHKRFERTRGGNTNWYTSHVKASPGRCLLKRVLSDIAMTVGRCGVGCQRPEALEDDAAKWVNSVKYFRHHFQKHAIPLDRIIDDDEVCVLCCGHIGWLRRSESIRRKGIAGHKAGHKQNTGYRKKCSVSLSLVLPWGASCLRPSWEKPLTSEVKGRSVGNCIPSASMKSAGKGNCRTTLRCTALPLASLTPGSTLSTCGPR